MNSGYDWMGYEVKYQRNDECVVSVKAIQSNIEDALRRTKNGLIKGQGLTMATVIFQYTQVL